MSGELLDDLSFLDNEGNESQFVYVGFWKRVLAALLDGLFLWIVFAIIEAVFDVLGMVFPSWIVNPVNELITMGLMILYFPILESGKRQATIGKQFLDIKVINQNGERLSFLHAFGRYLAKVLSYSIAFIGFIMVAFADKKQGLHDMICKTYVVEN